MRGYVKFFLIGFLLIGLTCGEAMAATVVADFSTSISGLDVQFNDESTATDSTIDSWTWDFGDSAGSSTSQSPSYTYTSAGTYTVRLTVVNESLSLTDNITHDVTVSAPVSTPTVDASFNVNTTSGTAPLAVQFTDTSTGATSWSWTFGDGSSSTDQDPVHTYADVGNYTVNLTAKNGTAIDTETTKITVRSETYYTGNRIWDASTKPSLDYTWTALSYSGFYYDLDSGESSETMTIHLDSYSDRTINSGDLEYSTQPIITEFEYGDWGSYQVIGFMAEKYFAGYTEDSEFADDDISMMSDGQLSKILIDDDEKVSAYSGSSLQLEDGYALEIVELDLEGDKVFVSLTKDGDEVDSGVVSSDSTYVYEDDLGSVDDVPIIAVYFEDIFSGRETSAVFVEGIFQISDEYIQVDSGDTYGEMEITKLSSTEIEMENEDSISLSRDDTIDIMGEIKIKVADDSKVRYYPFVEITKEATESLDIDMPETVNEDETFTITVTSRGAAVSDVSVEFDGDSIGTTSRDGIVTYEPKEAGKFKVSVEKEGYISASEQIEVISPDDETKKMSIEISPDEVYEGEMITISTVKSIGGEAIEDAEILYDNNPIGTTSEDGTLSYTTKEVGMHEITATADGYIDAELNLEVLAIEADFEFSNLLISPLEIKAGKDVTIKVDVSNDGKAEGEYNVELFINGNVTDSQQIALGVGESATLEFTHSEDEPGTYEASIQELSGTFEVLEKGSSALLYVLGILGVLVVIAAGYMFTAGGWTVEMVSEKISEFIKSIR